jgi:hypothetical protein
MILIEHDGERLLVESLEGYDGATVIAENVPLPPSEFCTWNGEWVEDEEAKVRAEEMARIEAMTKAELIALLRK